PARRPPSSTRLRYTTLFRSEPEPQVVLRQENLRHAREHLRLVCLHPKELGRGESGKDRIAGDRAKTGVSIQHRRLRMCARVVPRSEEHTSELQSRENLVCRL